MAYLPLTSDKEREDRTAKKKRKKKRKKRKEKKVDSYFACLVCGLQDGVGVNKA